MVEELLDHNPAARSQAFDVFAAGVIVAPMSRAVTRIAEQR
jgi:hypothetical protein